MNAIVDLLQAILIMAGLVLLFLQQRRVGRLNRRIDGFQARSLEQPETEALCGCTHHQCFHDDNGCGHEWATYDGRIGQNTVRTCGCKRYTGPEQLPTVIP